MTTFLVIYSITATIVAIILGMGAIGVAEELEEEKQKQRAEEKRRIANIGNSQSALASKLQHIRAEEQKLKKQLANCKGSNGQLQDALNEYEAHRQETETKHQAEVSKLTDQITMLEYNNKSLTEIRQVLEYRIKKISRPFQEEIQALQAENESLARAFDARNKEFDLERSQLQDELKRTTKNLESEIQALERKNEKSLAKIEVIEKDKRNEVDKKLAGFLAKTALAQRFIQERYVRQGKRARTQAGGF